MYTWYAFISIYVSITMFIVRGPNLAKAHRHTRHTRVGDTQAQRNTHKHSAHTSMLHVCCKLVGELVPAARAPPIQQDGDKHFMRPGKVVTTFSYDTFLLLYVYYVWISVVPRPTEFGPQIDHILICIY